MQEAAYYLYSYEAECCISNTKIDELDDEGSFCAGIIYASNSLFYSPNRCKGGFKLVASFTGWQLGPFLSLQETLKHVDADRFHISYIFTSTARDYCMLTSEPVENFQSFRETPQREAELARVREICAFGTRYAFPTWEFAFTHTTGDVVPGGSVPSVLIPAIRRLQRCAERACPACGIILSSFRDLKFHFETDHLKGKCPFCEEPCNTKHFLDRAFEEETQKGYSAPDGVSHLAHMIAAGFLSDSRLYVSCASRHCARIARLWAAGKITTIGSGFSKGAPPPAPSGGSGGGDAQNDQRRGSAEPRSDDNNNNNNNDDTGDGSGRGGSGGGGSEPMDTGERSSFVCNLL